MIVLHATAGSARGALAWLTKREARVSAHYLIDKAGHTYQLVADEYAAWHAGRASWKGQTAINEVSLGIELENSNDGHDPYPTAQIDALLRLAQAKVDQYGIAPEMVTRHLDIALPHGRKSDPAGFPWAEFIRSLFPAVPPPNTQPGRPRPPDARSRLAQKLRAEAYRQVGAIDHQDWAIGRAASDQSLGMPIGRSFEITVGSRSYTAQSFGRDTLVSPTGEWQQVEQLSKLVAPAQQALREALLQGIYHQAGEVFHPDWAFHQYALRTPIGPPLSPSFRFTVAGQEYSAACYALDVLCNPVGRWKEIARLSDLLSAGRQPELANQLQQYWSERAGSQVRPEWPLYQYALRERLGAPLGPSFRIADDGHDYVAEAFALDVIACEIGAWQAIFRMSSLTEASES